MAEQQRQIQIEADNDTLRGSYANNMVASHTKEEFVLDFMLIHPPKGKLVQRTIVSPGHLKRIVKALQENLKRYEASFGEIPENKGPETPEMGFKG